MSESRFAFGYGSLLDHDSLSLTLGRPPELISAELRGWRRRWSLVRDNLLSEKTFELTDGSLPPVILGLNIEPDPGGALNGAVFELSDAELERLDVREMRYDRVDVSGAIDLSGAAPPESVLTYTAKAEHFSLQPPRGAVILASYANAVERAVEALGPGQLERYRLTTGPHPVEVVEATLLRGDVPAGNPTDW